MSNAETWRSRFEKLLTHAGTEVAFRSFGRAAGGWRLVLTAKDAAPRRIAAFLSQTASLSAHVLAWPQHVGNLEIELETCGRSREPLVSVRDGGASFLIPEPSGREARNRLFIDWFGATFGIEFPSALPAGALRHIGDGIYASPGITARQIEGMPHRLAAAGKSTYTLATFWGYGTNSYALYYSHVIEGVRVHLRLPFGGVYMDPERTQHDIAATLEGVAAIISMAVENHIDLDLALEMGRGAASVGGESVDGDTDQEFLDAVQRLVDAERTGRGEETP